MSTLSVDLDGYTDLPPGKIANVVTYLEMFARPAALPEPVRPDLAFRLAPAPTIDRYRALIRTVGEAWLWYSPLVMPDEQLAAILGHPQIEVYTLEREGTAVGIAELDRRVPGEVELSFFGVAGT